MKTELVTKVAEVAKTSAPKKKEMGSLETRKIADKVEISFKAMKQLADSKAMPSGFEKSHFEKVARIEAQVRAQHYDVNPTMIDQIANKVLKLVS